MSELNDIYLSAKNVVFFVMPAKAGIQLQIKCGRRPRPFRN
jgi:hypothetical protein